MTEKVCLITGGTRGIGLAISYKMAELGYTLATLSRTASELDTFRGKMEERGAKSLTFCGDIADDTFLKSVAEEVSSRLGGINVLINNAGLGKSDSILDANVNDWDQTLQVNLRAPMILTKLCLPHLLKNPESAVINIASIAGQMGMAGSSAYCASKFGLIGFTQSLFEEVREQGVKVCAICPGYVDTKLIPNRKALVREQMIRSEDVADAVAFVLGASASACPVEITIRPQRYPFRK